MKTTCWYEERRNLVGVFDFRSFHRFFVLVARWRWACFVFFFSFFAFCFHCQGRIFFLKRQTGARGVACLVVLLDHASRAPVLFVCLFCKLFVYVYFLVALHLYIWGNIVLNTCMAFVVIKIVSLVSLFVNVNVNVVLDKIFVSVRSISRIVSACASL